LKLLLNLSRNYPGRFHVRVSRFADRFHEKMYLMKSNGKISTILGSSNLTKKGLARRSEMNILITEERGETLLDSLWKYFDRNFYKNAVPLSSTIVRRYARHATQARQARGRTPRKDWSWLESKLRSRRIDVSETGRTWFDELRDDLPSSVSRKVDRETGWNHDSSVSIDDSPALIGNLRVGDRLALLESKKGVGKRRRRFISMNLVVDRAEVPTSIYRHFVEFKQMTRRRVTSSLDESLEPIWSKRNQPLDRSRTTMLQKFFQSG